MKNWYTSKTVWIGIFQILGGFFAVMAQSLNGEIGTEATITAVIIAGLGLKDVILRAITTESIK